MGYKSFVTFIRHHERDAPLLSAAAGLTEAMGGHLSAVCMGIDRTNPGAYYAGATAIALQNSIQEAQEEALANEAGVTHQLGVWQIPWDCRAITTQVGALAPAVGMHAQFADLVVLGQPYGAGRSEEDVVVLESALFQTRVPVLVLPHEVDRRPDPRRIVVAWNQSPEALAAIRGAMPFLTAADEVNIAVIDPPSHGPDRSDPGGVLAEMLSRHGVRADISVLARSMPRISDVLARQCEDKNAEMLVMGAYGHSRLREAILGGATRNMLEHSAVPLVLAH